MRTRTPREWQPQLGVATHTICRAHDCDATAIHGHLCYHHTHQSRQRLAGEHRRLQHHHGALQKTAATLIDLLLHTNLAHPIVQAVTQLQRHLPPTPEEQ